MIQDYSEMKDALDEITGMSEDLIHVHVGLAIFVATAFLLRRRIRSSIPLAIVAFLALANELVDFAAGDDWELGASILDFLNTLLWPLVLFLLARRGSPPTTDKVESAPSPVEHGP